jgi:hypothetical protein
LFPCSLIAPAAAHAGLVLAEIVERTEARGLRDWTGVAQKTATMSGTLSQDAAFVKEAKRGGMWSLACFHGVNADGERSEQRQLRELAALERRLTPGTVKMATFVVLRDAGPKGARVAAPWVALSRGQGGWNVVSYGLWQGARRVWSERVSGSWPTASKSEIVASTLVRQASWALSKPFDVKS